MTAQLDEAGRVRFGARDISGLIRIYESNYVRMAKLIPSLAECDRVMISRVAGALDLYLELIERQPYTTTLVLTYRFADGCECVHEPNARINVYHDVTGRRDRLALPASKEAFPPPMVPGAHAGAGPEVAHEPLPTQVVEILHVPGAYLSSGNNPGSRRRHVPR